MTIGDNDKKPCPHCGGEPVSARDTTFGRYWIFCKKCLASSNRYESEEQAIEAWNKRAEQENCKPANVVEVIINYLKIHGFDGLCNVNCGCGLDNLFLCGELSMECVPAYKHERTKCVGCHGCGEEYRDWNEFVFCTNEKKPEKQ